VQLKDIEKGQRVGYDGTYTARSKQRVAVVPAGFADSVPLTKTGKLTVVVNGSRRRVLGLVSMDQIVVDAKKDDRLGDKVCLFDPSHPPYTLAKEGDTTAFNIVTHLGGRVRFIYR
jgi:alanine racemase